MQIRFFLCHYARIKQGSCLIIYKAGLLISDTQITKFAFYCTTAHIMLFEQAANLLSKYIIIGMEEAGY